MTETKYPRGMFINEPHEKAPKFIRKVLKIKVDEFIPYLQEKAHNGYVTIDIKAKDDGSLYLNINDWKPEAKEEDIQVPKNPF